MKLFVCLLSVLCFQVSSRAAIVLSQTVGSVGEDIVSTRDVQIQFAIEKTLNPTGAKNQNYEIKIKDETFQNELASTLLEYVILKEAESFQVAKPDDSEVKEAVQKIEKVVTGNSYWHSLEVTHEELKAAVTRKMTAKKFIKIKTDLMTALVTDQDALNYYERNRLKFGQLPFSSFKDNIKTYLSQQQLEERIKTLFEVIKRKYKVRNYLVEGRQIG